MQMDKPMNDEELEKMFNEIDTDRTGSISWEEFIISTASKDDMESTDNLRRLFYECDSDGDGTINAEELKVVVKHFGTDLIRANMPMTGNLSDDQLLDAIMGVVDSNNDGVIDFAEFLTATKTLIKAMSA